MSQSNGRAYPEPPENNGKWISFLIAALLAVIVVLLKIHSQI